MSQLSRRRWLAIAPMAALAACAQIPRAPTVGAGEMAQWSGRLALRVETDPVQSFSAGFDLRGNARSGELSLYSPLGSTLGRMQWAPGVALLNWDGRQRSFDSIAALTHEATGTELPLASLFDWLSGQATEADGWSADLADLAAGKLIAQRTVPRPAVTLRLILD